MENLGLLMGSICLLTWGFSDIISKKGLDAVGVLKVLFWAQLFGALLIASVGVVTGELVGLTGETLAWMTGLGLLNVSGMGLYYLCFQHKGVALSVAIVKAWVLVATLLSIFIYSIYPTAPEWAAMGLILVGLFTITTKRGARIHFDKSYILPFFTMFIFGFSFFLIDYASGILNETWVTLGVKGFSALFILPLFAKKPRELFNLNSKSWLMVFMIGLLDGAGLIAFAYGAQAGGLTAASTVVSATPAFVAMLSVLILKEKLTDKQMIGVGCAAFGLVLLAVV